MKAFKFVTMCFLALVLLAGCGTPATPVPTAMPVPASPTPEPQPAVGGTFVFALRSDPTTLDFQNQAESFATTIGNYVGAALVAQDPVTRKFVPWLATSWTVSDDGLTWTFNLRTDVKFHNGTAFTAADMAWTLNRAIDKDNPTYMGALLDGMASAEAVDASTLKITMLYPNYSLLNGLSSTNLQPMSQAHVEQMGDQIGRNPMSVGPYKFVSWTTSQEIILERNPDYTWGPSWSNGQPPMIQTLDFRIIPEYSTRLAGIQAGEIDFSDLQIADLVQMSSDTSVNVLKVPGAGIQNGIFMNVERDPFTDVRVRQAFNYAINKDDFITAMAQGQGEPSYGPISSSSRGYWPEAESIGYHFDLTKAEALMAEAGYAPGADGILQKDGVPLVIEIKSNADYFGNLAVIFQDQMKALGVQINVQMLEPGALMSAMDAGDYTMVTSSLGLPDNQALYYSFHSSMINYLNTGRVNDPELDKLLDKMAQAVTEDVNLQAGYDAQKLIIQKAYMISTFSGYRYYLLSTRAKDAVYSTTGQLWLDAAYIDVK